MSTTGLMLDADNPLAHLTHSVFGLLANYTCTCSRVWLKVWLETVGIYILVPKHSIGIHSMIIKPFMEGEMLNREAFSMF